ncbi:MAG TPA: globin family protein [Stellaceae bacterium]|nr:globin family protein [Stellaceae bacterium]
MTPEQKQLVRDSFAKLVPIADDAAALFYQRLFTLDPKLRALFTHDMKEQGRKLMSMIATAVAQLDKVEALVPVLRELGKRHVGYGVRDSDYDTVATALLWTLEQGLGADFTPALKAAWTTCYGVLAGEMKAGGRQPAA